LAAGGHVPILVRPVREQLEHDRVIRLIQAKMRRRYDAAINPGEEKGALFKLGAMTYHPDVVLTETGRASRLAGVVEVETAESVNQLEAMAQWAHFARARVPFHLYVPASAVDIARRLCSNHQIQVAEMWSYHTIGDQIRFTLVQRAPVAAAPRRGSPAKPRRSAGVGRKTAARSTRSAKGARRSARPGAQKRR
jgi:hypothetical protein